MASYRVLYSNGTFNAHWTASWTMLSVEIMNIEKSDFCQNYSRSWLNTCWIPWPCHKPWSEQSHPRCLHHIPDLHHTQLCSAYWSAKDLPGLQTLDNKRRDRKKYISEHQAKLSKKAIKDSQAVMPSSSFGCLCSSSQHLGSFGPSRGLAQLRCPCPESNIFTVDTDRMCVEELFSQM